MRSYGPARFDRPARANARCRYLLRNSARQSRNLDDCCMLAPVQCGREVRRASGKCHDKVTSDRPDPLTLRDIQCHLTGFPTRMTAPRGDASTGARPDPLTEGESCRKAAPHTPMGYTLAGSAREEDS